MMNEQQVREQTIGNLQFENKEQKDRLNAQFLGFRTLKEVLIVGSLVLIFILAWSLTGGLG